MQDRNIKILAGTASKHLVRAMMSNGLHLAVEPAEYVVGRFPDGEVRVEFGEGEVGNVRDRDVFIVNSITPPTEEDPHDHFMETLLLVDAAHRSSAHRITVVAPYLGYNCQDRKTKPRVPISAAVVMKHIAASGANRVLVCDLHAEATITNFDPLIQDQIYASRIAVPYLQSILQYPYKLASPDTGGTKRASKFAKLLGTKGYVIFDKGERPEPGVVDEEGIQIIGDVADQHILLVDDIIRSGGTMIADAEAARRAGAKSVTVFGTHGVLCDGAVQKLDACEAIDRVIVTDTIYHDPKKLRTKRLKEITILPAHTLFSEAIMRIHRGHSISEMIL